MIRVGVVGVGTIGAELARECIATFKEDVRLIGVVDIDPHRESVVRKRLGLRRKFTLAQLVPACDLLIEAAAAGIAYHVAKMAITHGKDVMIMSSGGLIGHETELYRLAAAHRTCVYLPSGAVSGVDGLKSASVGKVKRVELTTRKVPNGFKGAPYVLRKKIDLNSIRKDTLLFEGTAQKAIQGFPQNINISATLSLAGLGPKKTRVKIYACPGLQHHIHEVSVEGEFGNLYTRTQNLPSKHNPKTSHLAIMSAIATLHRIFRYVKIGT